MKVVILAGGFGTRLSEETQKIPKPMVRIGGKPILWHIMKLYAHHGFTDFIICLGYKGYVIKEYFANYFLHNSDVEIDLHKNELTVHNKHAEPWKVTLVDTGLNTMTGGRLRRIAKYLDGETFLMTYGDGLSDVDIAQTVKFHKAHGKLATLTAVQPKGKFGALELEGDTITDFSEKKDNVGRWVNGGFFVLEPQVLEYIEGDHSVWERGPLVQLASKNQLIAYRYTGFWEAMDKLYDKLQLEKLWAGGEPPWKVWDE